MADSDEKSHMGRRSFLHFSVVVKKPTLKNSDLKSSPKAVRPVQSRLLIGSECRDRTNGRGKWAWPVTFSHTNQEIVSDCQTDRGILQSRISTQHGIIISSAVFTEIKT